MNFPLIPLEAIQIAQPCRADWNNMTGDERARFCGSCHKNVYDISQLTRAEAHQLIAEREGELCLRLHRRPDGTVITSDCPVGKREVVKPMWWTLAGFIALMGSGVAVANPSNPETVCQEPTAQTSLVDKARAWPLVGAVVNQVAPQPDLVVMGGFDLPPSPAPPVPTNVPQMSKITDPSMVASVTPAPLVAPISERLAGKFRPTCEKLPEN